MYPPVEVKLLIEIQALPKVLLLRIEGVHLGRTGAMFIPLVFPVRFRVTVLGQVLENRAATRTERVTADTKQGGRTDTLRLLTLPMLATTDPMWGTSATTAYSNNNKLTEKQENVTVETPPGHTVTCGPLWSQHIRHGIPERCNPCTVLHKDKGGGRVACHRGHRAQFLSAANSSGNEHHSHRRLLMSAVTTRKPGRTPADD